MFLYHFSKNDDDKRLKSEILGFDNVSSECLNFEECSKSFRTPNNTNIIFIFVRSINNHNL